MGLGLRLGSLGMNQDADLKITAQTRVTEAISITYI